MSLHVLDTNTLVLFQEGHGEVCRRVLSHPIDELATTAITVEEQLSGWYTLLRRAKDAGQLAQSLVAVATQRLSHLLDRPSIHLHPGRLLLRFVGCRGARERNTRLGQ